MAFRSYSQAKLTILYEYDSQEPWLRYFLFRGAPVSGVRESRALMTDDKIWNQKEGKDYSNMQPKSKIQA